MNEEIHIKEVYAADNKCSTGRPMFQSGVSAGFPSPADDYIDRKLDLNDLLIANESATYYLRVEGDSMQGSGIFSDDILIVDRSLNPIDGNVIIAVLNGELTVKRFKKQQDCIMLMPDNENYKPIKVTADMDFEIWGVVTNSVHKL